MHLKKWKSCEFFYTYAIIFVACSLQCYFCLCLCLIFQVFITIGILQQNLYQPSKCCTSSKAYLGLFRQGNNYLPCWQFDDQIWKPLREKKIGKFFMVLNLFEKLYFLVSFKIVYSIYFDLYLTKFLILKIRNTLRNIL